MESHHNIPASLENKEEKKGISTSNEHLMVYNIFPPSYQKFQSIINQLPDIAKLSVNCVWLNPFFTVGKKRVKRHNYAGTVSGSLYAMSDKNSLNTTLLPDISKEKLREFTSEAIKHGLTPIFDLVLNHIAIDEKKFNSSSYEHWYKKDGEWDDVKAFAYEETFVEKDGNVCWETFQALWKPLIDKCIEEYGFRGVRVDAARLLPKAFQDYIYTYIKQKCQAVHQCDPVIFAEVLFDKVNTKEISDKLKDTGITHVTNSFYWAPFDKESRHASVWKQRINLSNVWLIRQIASVGTVGFTSSHDTESLYMSALNGFAYTQARHEKAWNFPADQHDFESRINEIVQEKKNDMKPEEIEKAMKERIAAIAFTSDAGWSFICGDEFGRVQKSHVFTSIKSEVYYEGNKNWEGKFNLVDFISKVNQTLKQLPLPNKDFWPEHVVLSNYPDLVIILQHNGQGFKARTDIILINLSDQAINLTQKERKMIGDLVANNHDENAKAEAREAVMHAFDSNTCVHTVGKVDPFSEEKNLKNEGKNFPGLSEAPQNVIQSSATLWGAALPQQPVATPPKIVAPPTKKREIVNIGKKPSLTPLAAQSVLSPQVLPVVPPTHPQGRGMPSRTQLITPGRGGRGKGAPRK